MRRVILGLAIAAAASAQDMGASVFNKSCAVGYCHGSGGTAGRAPKLTGRAFEHAFVHKVTRDGIPNTGMPGWKDRLNPTELDAVIAYVVNISGGKLDPKLAGSGASGPSMPTGAKAGRGAFFDALKGEHRCSTCHALDEMGIAIGPNLLGSIPAGTAAMRAGKPAGIRLAKLASGESFPALVVEQNDAGTKLFDLTLPLPVLRTVPKGGVSFSSGSGWDHAKAAAKYTDAELASILAYLRWLASR